LKIDMKRILVPIDCSNATPAVVDLARQVATAFGAEIHLVHVKEVSATPSPGTMSYGLTGMPELAPMSGVSVRYLI
jgi:nucleotide-binding universal stress UspA family protein